MGNIKAIGLFLLASLSPLQAVSEYDQYGYIGVGIGPLPPLPLPTINGGYRIKYNQHGLDLNAAAVIIGDDVATIKGAARYLYCFKPAKERQWYMGIGPQIGTVWVHQQLRKGVGISPEFLLGRERLSDDGKRRFFEIVIDYPIFTTEKDGYLVGCYDHVTYFPYTCIQYGWGF